MNKFFLGCALVLSAFATGCSDPCGDLADKEKECCGKYPAAAAAAKAICDSVADAIKDADSDACDAANDSYKCPY